MNNISEDDNVYDVTKWSCFKSVSDILGENAIFELERVRDNPYGDKIYPDKCKVDSAFTWKNTPQGIQFWSNVFNKRIPDNYKSISLEEEFIGSLIKKLHTLVTDSSVEIIITRKGVLLKGQSISNINITDLDADKITEICKSIITLESVYENNHV